VLSLQKVDMRFDYQDAFEASRSTGYEVLLYQCMRGDATLFTRNDLVEAAWRIAQPILDTWAAIPPRRLPELRGRHVGTQVRLFTWSNTTDAGGSK
jgi:glucose-6-phosphate 1-dehydrogenase